MSNGRSGGSSISWLWIILSFVFQLWPIGIFLLFFKIFGDNKRRGAARTYGQPNTYRPAGSNPNQQRWDWSRQAQDVTPRPVQQNEAQAQPQPRGRAYSHPPRQQAQAPQPPTPLQPQQQYNSVTPTSQTPPHGQTAYHGGTYQGYRYDYQYQQGGDGMTAKQRALMNKIGPKRGKGLSIGGWITAGVGAFSAAIVFVAMLASGSWFFDILMVCALVATPMCIPGAVMAAVGGRQRDRAERCTTLFNMMRSRKTADIYELASAVPCSRSQATKDLRWMIQEGFFPGAYIDASKGMIIFAGAEPEPEKMPEADQPATEPGVFPEVLLIRKLNDEIADEVVSMHMDRLEELTHKIFTYVEANPAKEDRIRQFRNHYLPKTIKILESYARFERQGVAGANIRSAMKDVEQIMETLSKGFEKQLDMLFVDEALDVTTDINVLENMMGLQGLSADDPFQLELYGGDKLGSL